MAQFRIEYQVSVDNFTYETITADNYEVADDCVTFYNEEHESDIDGFVAMFPLDKVIKVMRIQTIKRRPDFEIRC